MSAGLPRPAAEVARLVAAAAANLAGWHEANLRALGYRNEHVDGLWLTPDRVPPIFFSAVAIRPGASAQAAVSRVPASGWVSISDPWGDLALSTLGFSSDGDHPWMVRPPGASGHPEELPPELRIERVTEPEGLHDFELAAAAGFGSDPQPRFTWHAPPALADPRIAFWRGLVGGMTVAGSMSFVHAGVVGVYSVSTVPGARRRGYASALTWVALTADPALPSVLQPSPMAESLYGRLGYERFAAFRSWARPGPYLPERSGHD